MSIGDAEIKTQERVIRFFKDPEILGYQYIGNLSDHQNKNIKEDRLRQYLRLKGYRYAASAGSWQSFTRSLRCQQDRVLSTEIRHPSQREPGEASGDG